MLRRATIISTSAPLGGNVSPGNCTFVPRRLSPRQRAWNHRRGTVMAAKYCSTCKRLYPQDQEECPFCAEANEAATTMLSGGAPPLEVEEVAAEAGRDDEPDDISTTHLELGGVKPFPLPGEGP